jgi:TPR repeat protein
MFILRICLVCIIFAFLSACAAKHASPPPEKIIQPPSSLREDELGRRYLIGLGVPVNYAKAFYHFKNAADHGDAFAQNEVAYLYASGKGVQKDYAKAFQYYQQAADLGLASAQYNVGKFYLQGLGVRADRAKATSWLKKSASNGFQPAATLLKQLNAGPVHHEATST